MQSRSSIVLVTHNLRSTHNVGSLLRTADGLGIDQVILTGYTPYPLHDTDSRLPHLAAKIDKQINKTALGAANSINWQHQEDIKTAVDELRRNGYQITALEQAANSADLANYRPPAKIAIIVGREVEGIEPDVIAMCDQIIEIPMQGQKESFNVAVAAAIALYHCSYLS